MSSWIQLSTLALLHFFKKYNAYMGRLSPTETDNHWFRRVAQKILPSLQRLISMNRKSRCSISSANRLSFKNSESYRKVRWISNVWNWAEIAPAIEYSLGRSAAKRPCWYSAMIDVVDAWYLIFLQTCQAILPTWGLTNIFSCHFFEDERASSERRLQMHHSD